jgi:hypothetical protein
MFAVSKQISLSSKSATMSNSSLNSSCYFEIANIFKRTDNVKLVMIGVSHCEIPVSLYVVNNTNNKLVLQLNNFYGSTGTNTTYTFVNGNYNATTFKTMLLSVMGNQWQLALNSTTGVYTLTNTSFSFIIRSSLSTCNKLIGFGTTTDYTSQYSPYSLLFPYPCNFLGTSRINIKSTTLLTDNLDSGRGGHSGAISTISNNAELFGIILYENTNNFRNIIYNDFLNSIDISITDENDNLLDFNGIHWYLTLQLDIFYDFSNIQNSNLSKLLLTNT